MPKKFNSPEEKLIAEKNRLEKQKYYEKQKRHEKQKKKELEKPCAYKQFIRMFMYEATGIKRYLNENCRVKTQDYRDHIKYCKLVEMFDAGAVCEHCICGKGIRYVFVVEYKNPETGRESMFCVGSECIVNSGNDALHEEMNKKIEELKISDYTCAYCKEVCIHKTGRVYDLFDVENKKCNKCKSKPWCEVCKNNLKSQPHYPRCVECWKKRVTQKGISVS